MSNPVPPQPIGIPYTDSNGNVSPAWEAYNRALQNVATGTVNLTLDVTGILPVANGGTGASSAGSSGDVLISNGVQFVPGTLATYSNNASSAQVAAGTAINVWIAPGTMQYYAADQTKMEAASDQNSFVTPGNQQYHPGIAKFFAQITYVTGTPSATTSYNVSSLTDTGVGQVTVNFTKLFSSTNFCVVGMKETGQLDKELAYSTRTTGSVLILNFDDAGLAADTNCCVAGYGDQNG